MADSEKVITLKVNLEAQDAAQQIADLTAKLKEATESMSQAGKAGSGIGEGIMSGLAGGAGAIAMLTTIRQLVDDNQRSFERAAQVSQNIIDQHRSMLDQSKTFWQNSGIFDQNEQNKISGSINQASAANGRTIDQGFASANALMEGARHQQISPTSPQFSAAVASAENLQRQGLNTNTLGYMGRSGSLQSLGDRGQSLIKQAGSAPDANAMAGFLSSLETFGGTFNGTDGKNLLGFTEQEARQVFVSMQRSGLSGEQAADNALSYFEGFKRKYGDLPSDEIHGIAVNISKMSAQDRAEEARDSFGGKAALAVGRVGDFSSVNLPIQAEQHPALTDIEKTTAATAADQAARVLNKRVPSEGEAIFDKRVQDLMDTGSESKVPWYVRHGLVDKKKWATGQVISEEESRRFQENKNWDEFNELDSLRDSMTNVLPGDANYDKVREGVGKFFQPKKPSTQPSGPTSINYNVYYGAGYNDYGQPQDMPGNLNSTGNA